MTTAKIGTLSGLAIAMAAVALADTAAAQVSVQYLSSARHSTVTFSDTDVQNMFNSATNILMTDNDQGGTFDISCMLGFERSSSISSFTLDGGNNDGVVDDLTELNYLIGQPGYVKIVPAINYCAGVCTACLGCSLANSTLLIEDSTASGPRRGQAMAHEFGHTVGLRDSTWWTNVMFLNLTDGNVMVNACECNRFRTGDLSAEDKPCLDVIGVVGSSFAGLPIEEIAARGFQDTVPVEVEDYYDQSDVALLKEMLLDPDQARNARTILNLIGLISDGSASDVQAITDFTKAPSDARYTGGNAVAAGVALGYLANRTGNAEALEHVIAMAKSRDADTRKGGLLGLATSGSARGRAELSALKRVTGRVSDAALEHAIVESDLFHALGLRGYYARDHH